MNSPKYFREEDLNNLFDIEHADSLERIKIEEGKGFLERQWEPGYHICLICVDKNLIEREKRVIQRKLEENNTKGKDNVFRVTIDIFNVA